MMAELINASGAHWVIAQDIPSRARMSVVSRGERVRHVEKSTIEVKTWDPPHALGSVSHAWRASFLDLRKDSSCLSGLLSMLLGLVPSLFASLDVVEGRSISGTTDVELFDREEDMISGSRRLLIRATIAKMTMGKVPYRTASWLRGDETGSDTSSVACARISLSSSIISDHCTGNR